MLHTRSEMDALFDIQDKIAVVTGGGGGIGQAIAMAYAAKGAKVAIIDYSTEKLAETTEVFRDSGHTCLVLKCDISDESQVVETFQEINRVLGPVDILVNSAGITLAKPSIETSAQEFNRVVETNVTGTFNCCKAAAHSMIPRMQGHIINIGSIRGSVGVEWGMPAYTSSKAGVHMLTKQLAVEWAKYKICVNCLIPNLIVTPMSKYILENKPRRELYLSRIPMGEIGYPEEFMAAAIFLASPGSKYVTGQLLYIDGGASAG